MALGGTAQIIGRVAAGTLTLGATEALGLGKKAGKVTSQVFLPGSDKVGNAVGNPDPLGVNKTAAPQADAAPPQVGQTEEEKQRDARLAADKRRKDFQNLGRSSTILTGPGGLAGSGAGQSKSLLGM